MIYARVAAVLTWVYVAGFGLSTIPVALHLRGRGQLLTFFDLFEMYGGPWSARLAQSTFIGLLIAFLAVNAVTAWAAWLLCAGTMRTTAQRRAATGWEGRSRCSELEGCGSGTSRRPTH